MMDPCIGWFQPEQNGQALNLWNSIWKRANMNGLIEVKKQEDSRDGQSYENGDTDQSEIHQYPSPFSQFLLKRTITDNPASTYNFNERPDLCVKYNGTPWFNRQKVYSPGIFGLHQEIEDFYSYMKPTAKEQYMREDVVKRLSNIVKVLWPEAKTDFYGSFRTGLYLPTSDIDLVIFGNWKDSRSVPLIEFHTLEQEILKSGIVDRNNIKVLDKAHVPIIKLTDSRTKVRVDISFNTIKGIGSANFIEEQKKLFPNLKKLVFVLKQFLLQRDLKEVFSGGISSYSLILMVVSYMQLHPRKEARDRDANLGVLLLEFFELFGKKFNYYQVGIRVRDGGSFVSKNVIHKNMGPNYRPNILCIEDPLDTQNDIGKNSFGALAVKRAFEYAFTVLHQAVGPLCLTTDSSLSILGRIIRVTDEVVDYRLFVEDTFHQLFPDAPNPPDNNPNNGSSSSDPDNHDANKSNEKYFSLYSNSYDQSQSHQNSSKSFNQEFEKELSDTNEIICDYKFNLSNQKQVVNSDAKNELMPPPQHYLISNQLLTPQLTLNYSVLPAPFANASLPVNIQPQVPIGLTPTYHFTHSNLHPHLPSYQPRIVNNHNRRFNSNNAILINGFSNVSNNLRRPYFYNSSSSTSSNSSTSSTNSNSNNWAVSTSTTSFSGNLTNKKNITSTTISSSSGDSSKSLNGTTTSTNLYLNDTYALTKNNINNYGNTKISRYSNDNENSNSNNHRNKTKILNSSTNTIV